MNTPKQSPPKLTVEQRNKLMNDICAALDGVVPKEYPVAFFVFTPCGGVMSSYNDLLIPGILASISRFLREQSYAMQQSEQIMETLVQALEGSAAPPPQDDCEPLRTALKTLQTGDKKELN
jgi:hypothetical protein